MNVDHDKLGVAFVKDESNKQDIFFWQS